LRERELERPRGLEPPPGAWQAPVLPLYYGRPVFGIYSTPPKTRQARRQVADNAQDETPVTRTRTGAGSPNAPRDSPLPGQGHSTNNLQLNLAYQDNARGLHDGRPFLPVRKSRSFGPVGVHTGELLAIAIVHGYLPVAVFATLIIAKSAAFLRLFQWRCPVDGRIVALSIPNVVISNCV
jgi:hypothetical protein